MSQKILYKGKNIVFKDSYSILTMKLERFPNAFKLNSGKKEMFPYNYYTFKRLFEKHDGLAPAVGKIDYVHHFELKRKWKQDQFEENIASLKLYVDINGNHSDTKTEYFDMKGYVEFYCNQDVNILAQGFNKFRNDCLSELKIDVDEILSAPSLANRYFEQNLYYKVDNFYKYSGVVREFIQGAVCGGRCMSRDNEKYKIYKDIADFDAVSLYPSAMNRLFLPIGKPSVLEPHELNLKYLLDHTALEQQEQPTEERYITFYIVDIKILKVNKPLHFSNIVIKNTKTKTNLNTNDAEGKIIRISNIRLEDLVKFQGIECEVLRGYKWTSPKNDLIKKVIKHVFNKRLEYKKQGNPLQEIYKLIMNSAYGKTIQKPIKDKLVYLKYETRHKDRKTGEEIVEYPLNKYKLKNSAKIKEINKINKNLYCVKVTKPTYDYSSCTLLGVIILDMSKRIMNEVMCTAEDLDIGIYYQDTDSMHIEKDKLNLLADEYKKRYNNELIGKAMGQFHNDFDELTDSWAIETIICGKKCYCDLLTDGKGKYSIHKRAKGIALECIDVMAEEMFNKKKIISQISKFGINNDSAEDMTDVLCEKVKLFNILKIYDSLLKSKAKTFDLKAVKACMKHTPDRQVMNCKSFNRKLQFEGEYIIVK